ncbi:MAG TPA: hypothetical protein VFT61_06315 [Sphingomicrobium sp.]|nr:hypothetical protein [Sphingomicrobium sp.]
MIATATIVVLDHVTLDLNGGTLELHLSDPNSVGVRLRSNAALANGHVVVQSLGRPGTQAAIHAPVVVGPLYGEGGGPGRLSPDENVHGWTIRNLILSSDKNVPLSGDEGVGAVAIQVLGGCHDGLIENIVVPDSPFMSGAVHLDWGTIGQIHSSQIALNRETFDGGKGYTSHPHNITVRGIRIGRLSRPLGALGGTFGIRLSGVHDIKVSDVTVRSATEAALFHTAGDLGFEFALPDARERRCQGIRVRDVIVDDAQTGYLIWSNSFADNVARAVAAGYRPLLDPIHNTDIEFERVAGSTSNAARAAYGVRIDHQRGGRIVDCRAVGFKSGFFIDEQVYDVELVRPVAIGSGDAGMSVGHPYRPPARIRVIEAVARGNGGRSRGGVGCGLSVGRSQDVSVIRVRAPVAGPQNCAVRIAKEAQGARVIQ